MTIHQLRVLLHQFVLYVFAYFLAGDVAGLAFDIYANQEANPPEWMLHSLQGAAYTSLALSLFLFFSGFAYRGTQRWAMQAMWWWQVVQLAASLHGFSGLSRAVGTHELMQIQNFPSVMFYRSPEFYGFCLWSTVASTIITAFALWVFQKREPSWNNWQGKWLSRGMFFGAVRHSVVACACCAFVFESFLTLAVEGGTSGGLVVKQEGVFSRVITYTKGDHKVVVVPMIHIGDREFYELTVDRFASSKGLTLLEGVSGGGTELKKLNHRDIASAVGVSAQSDEMLKGCKPSHATTEGFLCTGKKMRYEFADLDFKDFKPITQAYLKNIGEKGAFGDIAGEMAAMTSPSAFLIGWDIEDNREDRLFREFDQKGKDENLVVIPWGAAHAFRIGKRLEDRGFKAESADFVRVISFRSLLKALVGVKPAKAEKKSKPTLGKPA
jgi:hypothetical protein